MAGAIAVIGVPVVDDEGWAERRDAHDRVTTIEWRNRAMIDFDFDPGVCQSQYATVPLRIAARSATDRGFASLRHFWRCDSTRKVVSRPDPVQGIDQGLSELSDSLLTAA